MRRVRRTCRRRPDRRRPPQHLLFQPLLDRVATARLSRSDIATPIRSVRARQANTSAIIAKVPVIEPAITEIDTTNGRIGFDDRVGWEAHALGLKKITGATSLRRKILIAFERAEDEPDEAERRAMVSVVVIDGGPTGVEKVGAIAELARGVCRTDPRNTRTVLVEAGPRLLAAFDPDLSEAARQSLNEPGAAVRFDSRVTDCSERG